MFNSRLLATALLAVVMLSFRPAAFAQDDKKEQEAQLAETVKQMVEAKDFIFQVESISPMKGGTRQVNPGYTLKVKGDTLSSELPYLGRLYTATINGGDGGIKFQTTQYDYEAKPRKKGGWDIRIRPREVPVNPDIYLTVHENGSADARFNFSDRQPITYYGYIEAPKKK